MVKHPKYQAMDDARQEAIPKAFEKYCSSEYMLVKIPPKKEIEPKSGPIPRPTFQIVDQDQVLVAHFHPGGYGECHKEHFKKTFKKMQKYIENVAADALRNFEGR